MFGPSFALVGKVAVWPSMGLGRELAALFGAFFAAGFLGAWIAVPTPLGGWNRLFLSLALTVPATLIAAAPGLATHSLATWNVSLGLSILAFVAAWRGRRALGGFGRRLRAGRLGFRRPPTAALILVVAAAAAAWFTVLVPEGVENTGSGKPNGTIVYYHWGIVGKVVEADGLPATLPEWGRQREFPYEYAFSVSHGASTADLAGESGFVLEERYRIAMVITALFAAFALWRLWLPSWWAWIAALLTMNVSRVETRFLVYKPEAFAFILLIWSAWLLDQAVERRSRLWGAMAGLVLASSFLAHPVSSLLVAPLWGGILIGRLAPKLRWRRPRVQISWRPIVAAAAVFLVLFGGLRTIIGTTGQDLSQSRVDGVDQTRVVYNLAYVSADPLARPDVPECSHPFGVYSSVRPFFSSNASWFFFDFNARSSVLLMIGGLILLGGAFLLQAPPRLARWPDSAKRAVVTWSCFGIGVYLLSVLICVYYSTWVPQRVGPMRLMPYWALIFPILIAGVAWAASRLLSGVRPSWRPRIVSSVNAHGPDWFGPRVAMIPALLISAAVIWTFTTITASQDRGVPPFKIAEPRAGGLSDSALRAYRWASVHLPADARILANGYTEGALGMLSHRLGLLDGRTPFAQPDPWRAEAIDLLSRSREFFLHPRSTPVPGDAGYVVVARRDANLGGSFFPTDFEAVHSAPALRRIRSFDGVALYALRRRSAVRKVQPSVQKGRISQKGDIGSASTKWLDPTRTTRQIAGAAAAARQQPSC